MLKVDIIIPALSEAETIAQAVQRAWAPGPNRVLVVDGGGDQTAAIAHSHGAEVFPCPPGRARQQNFGAAQSTADVLLFLHADCWLATDGVRQIREALKNPKVLGGAFRQRIESPRRIYRLLERGNDFRARVFGMPYGDQGIFLRRETFERLGRFPNVDLMEDLILMRRLRDLAKPILLPGPLHVSARRWQRHGVARQTLRNWSLLAARRLGANPNTLASYYRRHYQ